MLKTGIVELVIVVDEREEGHISIFEFWIFALLVRWKVFIDWIKFEGFKPQLTKIKNDFFKSH